MKPYYQRAGVTLWHGDCLEILPTLESGSVDAVVTDPPYGLGDIWKGGAGGAKSSWKIPAEETKSWDMETVNGVEKLPNLGKCIIWGGHLYDMPKSRAWLVWDKGQPDTWTTGQCELAWTNLDKPIRAFRMCQAVAHTEMGNKCHPTQKPLSLIKWCLKWLPDSQSILDPFTGSGTTGVACVQLGRKFIGIEIEEKYCEIAAKRLDKAIDEVESEAKFFNQG